jgi:tryptophan-rich sensory protein
MNRYAFIDLLLGGGLATGLITTPGEWYAALAKLVQLALNFFWTPVFFSADEIGLAFHLLVMLTAILGFIVTASRHDDAAAWLFVPYAVWVAFASVLNDSIWALN